MIPVKWCRNNATPSHTWILLVIKWPSLSSVKTCKCLFFLPRFFRFLVLISCNKQRSYLKIKWTVLWDFAKRCEKMSSTPQNKPAHKMCRSTANKNNATTFQQQQQQPKTEKIIEYETLSTNCTVVGSNNLHLVKKPQQVCLLSFNCCFLTNKQQVNWLFISLAVVLQKKKQSGLLLHFTFVF